jgi:Protein-disulfide isomerase
MPVKSASRIRKKFDQCLDSDRYRGLVIQDMEDGAGLGISGTPGFFIGRYDSVNRRNQRRTTFWRTAY